MNFLKETEKKLACKGYTWDDVLSIQTDDRAIPVEEFKKLANKEYDPDYGTAYVRTDLRILMKDGVWFSRREYDGSEWWVDHRSPQALDPVSDKAIETDIWDKGAIEMEAYRRSVFGDDGEGDEEEKDEDDLK